MAEKSIKPIVFTRTADFNLHKIENMLREEFIPELMVELMVLLNDKIDMVYWLIDKIHISPHLSSILMYNHTGDAERVLKVSFDLHFEKKNR